MLERACHTQEMFFLRINPCFGLSKLAKITQKPKNYLWHYRAMKESCLGGMSHTFTFMSHTFGCLLKGGPYQGNQVEGCSLWP